MSAPAHYDEAALELAMSKAASRRRAWLAVLPPLALGIAFLAFASHRLVESEREVGSLRGQADRLRQEARTYAAQVEPLRKEVQTRGAEIQQLETQVRSLEDRLRESTDLARHLHPIDLTDVKAIHSRWPRVAPVLGAIVELRERRVGWHLGGTSEAEGFDSPGFAAHVLARFGALPERPAGTDLVARSDRLRQLLRASGEPQPGDVMFYPAGYALFWFRDLHERPFVIGMTPSGIVALDPDFAPRVGIGRPPYR